MSEVIHSEDILDHEVWTQLATSRELTEQAKTLDNLSASSVETVTRIENVLGNIESRLKAADPQTLEHSTLNQLQKYSSALASALSNFVETKDLGQLNTANAQTAPLQVTASQVLVVQSPEEVAQFGESVTSFRRSAAQLLRHLSSDVDSAREEVVDASSQIAVLRGQLDAQKARVDEFIAQTQTQATATENQRTQTFQQRLDTFNSEFAEQQRTAKAAYDAQLAELTRAGGEGLEDVRSSLKALETDIAKEEADRSTRLDNAIEENASALSEARSQSSKLLEKQDQAGAALIAELESRRDKALELVGLIAATGVTGGYQRVANEEQAAARLWRKIALTAFVAFAGFSIYAFFSATGKDPFDVGALLRRVFVSGSLLLVGGFAARESNKHQTRERRDRQQELRLAALDPFLESLDEVKQAELKERLVDGFFSDSQEVSPKEHHGKLEGFTPEQLKLVLQVANTLVKGK